jgi:prepilin-type N-terminal cleavage/methylation domain-containing protein
MSTRFDTRGFALVELVMVLVLAAVLLSLGGVSLRRWTDRHAVRSAAELFARDLSLARGAAMRERAPVTLRPDDPGVGYRIVGAGERELAHRDYARGDGIRLHAIRFIQPEGGVVFGSRGMAELEGEGALGEVRFLLSDHEWIVHFNAAGVARVLPAP